jgi:hypothetical protein
MEDERFDRLTRVIADRATRRGVLAILAGLTGLGADASLARRHRRQPRGKDAQAAACRTLNQSCTPKRPKGPGKWRKCCVGLLCQDKRCRPNACAFGLTFCAGRCVETLTDPNNCGACAHLCPDGRSCCRGTCVNLQGPAHCGRCGNACPAGWGCCSGACVDLQDPATCGSCGNACRPGQVCQGGACVDRCTDDGQPCQTDAQCCRFPESVCLNLGVVRLCGPNCVGAASECSNNPVGPRCCAGFTCVGGRCRADVQPPCVAYGQICSPTLPCCDNVPCSGGLCRFN